MIKNINIYENLTNVLFGKEGIRTPDTVIVC